MLSVICRCTWTFEFHCRTSGLCYYTVRRDFRWTHLRPRDERRARLKNIAALFGGWGEALKSAPAYDQSEFNRLAAATLALEMLYI